MHRRKRTWFLLLAGLVVLGLVAREWWQSPEPTYQGQPLRYWLGQLVANDLPARRLEFQKASVAIQQIGTNGIPIYLRMIQRYSLLSDRLSDFVLRKSYGRLRFDSPIDQRQRAWRALRVLGSQAEPAIPALANLVFKYHARKAEVARLSCSALAYVGSKGVFALTPMLTNASPDIRALAAQGLSNASKDGRNAIPALINCLKDGSMMVRQNAVVALGSTGYRINQEGKGLDFTEKPLVIAALIERLGDANHWSDIARPYLLENTETQQQFPGCRRPPKIKTLTFAGRHPSQSVSLNIGIRRGRNDYVPVGRNMAI